MIADVHALLDTIQSHTTATGIILISVLMFFGSIVLAWLFIVKIPADYLTNDTARAGTFRFTHPIVGVVLMVCKNLFGVLFVLSGIIMLFIPGQGVMFIFLGLTLMDFPRKKQLIRRMLGWGNTLTVINRIRRQARRPPLETPTHP